MQTKKDQEYDIKMELVKSWFSVNVKSGGFATWLSLYRRPGELVRHTVKRVYTMIVPEGLRR